MHKGDVWDYPQILLKFRGGWGMLGYIIFFLFNIYIYIKFIFNNESINRMIHT